MVKEADWRKGEILSDEMFDEQLEQEKESANKSFYFGFVVLILAYFWAAFIPQSGFAIGGAVTFTSLGALCISVSYLLQKHMQDNIKVRMIYKKLFELEKRVKR